MGRLDPRCDAPGRRVDVREALLERRVDEHDERLLSLLSGCREAGELGGDVELHHVLEPGGWDLGAVGVALVHVLLAHGRADEGHKVRHLEGELVVAGGDEAKVHPGRVDDALETLDPAVHKAGGEAVLGG